MRNYYDVCGKGYSNKSINPSLLKNLDKIIMILDTKVTLSESKGIKEFLQY